MKMNSLSPPIKRSSMISAAYYYFQIKLQRICQFYPWKFHNSVENRLLGFIFVLLKCYLSFIYNEREENKRETEKEVLN